MRPIILAALILVSGVFCLSAQKIVDPQILAQQEEAQRKATETGYGDIELDVLHREITEKLKILSQLAEKGEDFRNPQKQEGDADIILPVAFGESIKSMSERYGYVGNCHLWFDGEKLTRVMFRFSRTNLLGIEFLEEQRDLINPTPFFKESTASTKEIPELDRNDDMIIRYSERRDQTKEFTLVREYTIPDIRYFEKRIAMIETYKKYLRRTAKMLDKKIYDRDLSQRVRVQYMLEMK